MKNLTGIFFAVISLFLILAFLGHSTSAQTTSTDTAQKYGITFPIGDLGNCADINSCKAYCQLPENQTQCIEFAKKKGFYKESTYASETLKAATTELGCTSIDACKALCANPDNFDKCNKFAANHNLGKITPKDPASSQILEKAKSALGCDSYQACMDFCTQIANHQKCEDFAKSVGLKGGVENKGPGGCSSNDSCKSYCSNPDNFKECSEYASKLGKKFKGPGGCNNTDTCRTYCQEHADICRQFSNTQNSNNQTDQIPQPCRDHPQECYEKCKANPTDCPLKNSSNSAILNSAKPGGFSPPSSTQNPKELYNKLGCDNPTSCYQICKTDPSKCSGFNQNTKPPQDNYNTENHPPYLTLPNQSQTPQPTVRGAKTGPLDFINSIFKFITSIL